MDPRVIEHARVLVNYCTSVKKGDNVLVMLNGEHDGLELATEVFKEASRCGGHPILTVYPGEAMRGQVELTPEEELAATPRNELELMKTSDVVIAVIGKENTRTLSSTDPKRTAVWNKASEPIFEEQLKKRWSLTLHPTNAHAQDAEMSLADYSDFVYSAVLRDWKSEMERMMKLKQIMDGADRVQLIGRDTDLSFSIKGRTSIIDDAKLNLPGGEVFTAPVDDSASGKILYDLPAIAVGREVMDIRLVFDKGKIVDYSAGKNEPFLKEMIETDDGSKRLGEFGVGTNRGINRFTKNILFDEKMAGTVHLAIGRAFEDCGGVNKSAVHWDMIKTMRPGEIIMDGKTIQKDGKFFWE